MIVSDFLTEAATDPAQDRLEKTMQYLDFTKQRPVLLQTLCAEELRVTMDGTQQSDRYGVQRKTARDDACGCNCAL